MTPEPEWKPEQLQGEFNSYSRDYKACSSELCEVCLRVWVSTYSPPVNSSDSQQMNGHRGGLGSPGWGGGSRSEINVL